MGRYIHILHGDDFVQPGFYRAIEERIEQHGDSVDLFIFRCLVVDDQGSLDSLTPRIKELESPNSDPSNMFLNNSVRTPGCVIKRSFYEHHGGFLNALVHTADREMWARATALGKALFINEPLAVYRYFVGNDTGRLARTGENMLDYYRLSQVMADRYSTYPRLPFLQSVADGAAGQVDRFKAARDVAAVQANLQVARALGRELPMGWKAFVKRVLKRATALRKLLVAE